MSTVKHTDGPWAIDHDGCTGPEQDLSINSADGRVAIVFGDTEAERLANAHLTKAGPAMLQVLKTTLGNIMSLGPAGALESVPMPFRVWADVVKSAIDEAEGRA